MELPLLTQLSRLDAAARTITDDAVRLTRASDGPLSPRSPGVRGLFARTEPIAQAAAAAQAAAGWDLLTAAQRTAAQRTIATAHNTARTATQLLGTGPATHTEVTTSVTDPASDDSARVWNDVRAGRDLPNVRIVGTLGRDAALGVANLFAQLPIRVVQQLDAQGARSTLFSGKLTDVWGYRSLRGVQPRGWPDGSTWDIVPGVANGHRMAADPSRDQKGKGHGTDSLAIHELGHVVDRAMATPAFERITTDPSWLDGPQAEVRADASATDYVRNYPEEWFAEALVAYTRTAQSNRDLAARYPRTAAFLAAALGAPRLADKRH